MHSHAAVSILAFSNSVGHSHAGRASLIGYVGGLADQLISARTLAHFVNKLFPKMLSTYLHCCVLESSALLHLISEAKQTNLVQWIGVFTETGQ